MSRWERKPQIRYGGEDPYAREYRLQKAKLEKSYAKKHVGFWKRLFHRCRTNPEDILWGGDGTQYCSICKKEIK